MIKTLHRMITILLLCTLLCVLMIPAAAQEPEINGYAADKPLTTYSHDTITGGLVYSTGDSYYSGKLYTGDTYTVYHSVSIPEGAVVKFARLYNYWTWSAKGTTGKYPVMSLTFDGNVMSPEAEYDDRKGWGIYDYPTGTWVYDVTEQIAGSGSHTVVVENTGQAGDFFCMDGTGLLVVYTDVNGKDIEYWIGEGCDILCSQMGDDGTPVYYTAPDQTITEMLKPAISKQAVKSATLWTIVQSGNWDANTLWVNDMNWTGICDGTPHPDLDIDVRDITRHLKDGTNVIRFQAVGDYAVPSGSILVVEKQLNEDSTPVSTVPEQGAEDTSVTSGSGQIDTAAEFLEPKDTPGFGATGMVASVLSIAFLSFHMRRLKRMKR